MKFNTLELFLEFFEKLSISCNMLFVNITLDLEAAINA